MDQQQRFTYALLDVDGTLIDSNDAHADSWTEILRGEGFGIRFEDVRPLIGMGADQVLPKLTGIEAQSARGKEISEKRKQLFLSAYLPKLKPFPGTRDLLLCLHKEGFKLALASSSGDELLNELLKKAGVADLFDARAEKNEATSSKPSPDLIERALRALGARPQQAIVIGDTPYDIAAAKKAGVASLAFLSGGWQPNELREALAIYDGPKDLLRRFKHSPLASTETRASIYNSGAVFPM